MASDLLTPDDVIDVIPGKVTAACPVESDSSNKFCLKGYKFKNVDVSIPSLRDYMLVKWKNSGTKLSYIRGRSRRTEVLSSGEITILSRGEASRWAWDNPIDVSHIYIPEDSIVSVANEVFQRDIDELNIDHNVRSDDPVLSYLMGSYESECLKGGVGGRIYASSIELQLCVHLIRQYANVKLHEDSSVSKLLPSKRRLLLDFVEGELGSSISIEDLAELVGLSRSHFIRSFSSDFGISPHAYIQNQRVEKAKQLLRAKEQLPLNVVAMECGFSDQSHMTRVFSSKLNITPLKYRKS